MVKKGFTQTKIGLMPTDWDATELQEIASVIDSLHKTPAFSEDGYSMVRVSDIKTGNLDLNGTLKVTEPVFEEFTRIYKPKRNDIVFSRVGSYGVSSFVETDEPFCMGQNTVVMTSKLSARYLYYILNSHSTRQQIEYQSYGSGYKSFSLKNIKELILPFPSTLSEQEAIADAMSDVDALIAGLDKLIAKKRDIKTGTMQQLLTGEKRLPGFGTGQGYKQTELGMIPEDWELGKLEGFFALISYGFTNPMPVVDSGVFMITAANINFGEIQYQTARCTTESAYQNLLTSKSKPKKDDILLTKDGTLGRVALVGDDKICINQSVAVIRPNDKIIPLFLKLLLESSIYQKKMLEDAGGSTIKHIYITIVNLMTIAVPHSKEEQQAITEVISDMDTEIAALETRRAKTQAIKQGMMQELLTGRTRLNYD